MAPVTLTVIDGPPCWSWVDGSLGVHWWTLEE